ncbi:MAG: DUF58 domain-containing protein [Akkermansiaceae bacterium]|nr:DUF58 domain-containing protein [Akkermansiaceae bacterium]
MTASWAVLGFGAGLVPSMELYWLLGGCVLALFLLVDFMVTLFLEIPEIERVLPGRFAMGIEQMVSITLRNRAPMKLKVVCYDGIPGDAESQEMPWQGSIPVKGYANVNYPVTLSERGMKEFAPAHLRVYSPMGLWSRKCRAGQTQTTRVYPNYEPVLRYALLAMDNRADQMGIVKKNRKGISREFHQLRDYQLGDMLSQVDWKATSKRLSLVSREYQEQRDQTVILAVDCGRRMRALDGGVPQFDHSLNAVLLLAYTALRQGDHVGVLGVGGSDRWLAPVKGVQSMTTILNHLYDYQTTSSPSDFTEAAERLMTRQRRRALVVMLSNVRGEDGHQLVDPLRMIRRRHVTILASLREEFVVERMEKPSATLDDALEVGATAIYLEERARMLGELRAHGVFTVDAMAKELPVALANAYLGAREMV